MTKSELERALPEAIAAGKTPVCWNMTAQAYYHWGIDDPEWRTMARGVRYGTYAPEPILGLPVSIVIGAHVEWKLYAKEG